jgi:hypothetical protein
MFRGLNDAIEKFSGLSDAIEKGTVEGIHRGFENRAFENCDGKDNPDERCPQKSGKCICAYVYWRQLPEWKQKLVEQPPRPSPRDCINAVLDMMAQQVLERRAMKLKGSRDASL